VFDKVVHVTSRKGCPSLVTYYIFLPSVLFIVTVSEKSSCTQGESYHRSSGNTVGRTRFQVKSTRCHYFWCIW